MKIKDNSCPVLLPVTWLHLSLTRRWKSLMSSHPSFKDLALKNGWISTCAVPGRAREVEMASRTLKWVRCYFQEPSSVTRPFLSLLLLLTDVFSLKVVRRKLQQGVGGRCLEDEGVKEGRSRALGWTYFLLRYGRRIGIVIVLASYSYLKIQLKLAHSSGCIRLTK